jgi:hypothetical protein
MSVETCRADPSSSHSISPVTCWICADLPAMDAGDVGEGAETAGGREMGVGVGGGSQCDQRDLACYPRNPQKFACS